MRVTVAVDNLALNGLAIEHGLSFFVETRNGSVLFDTGQSGNWLDNLRQLGKDPATLQAVSLSHGHYDHSGGVSTAVECIDSIRCYSHPDVFNKRYTADSDNVRVIGMPDESLQYQSRFTLNRVPLEIIPGVTLSGEILIRNESAIIVRGKFFLDAQSRNPDTFKDEQCLILQEKDSFGVLLGCSHCGVENNILAAMDAAGTDRLEWVAGGMHLASASDEQLDDLCVFLKSKDIGRVICCHCTGSTAFQYLQNSMGDMVIQGYAGMEWSLPESKI